MFKISVARVAQVCYNNIKGGVKMKSRFVTTLECETITVLKVEAAKREIPVNALLELLIKKMKEGK